MPIIGFVTAMLVILQLPFADQSSGNTDLSEAISNTPDKTQDLRKFSHEVLYMKDIVSDLRGVYRDGQVFLTWKEAETPEGTTFNVYMSHQPITSQNLSEAEKIGHHVERHSARDWWQDPASFFKNAEPSEPAGFVIENGADPLDPSGGLFVHTVTPQNAGSCYYAVTATGAEGTENTNLSLGKNSLQNPVVGQVALAQPVYIADAGNAYAKDSAKGRNLVFMLHGRGGGYTAGGEHPQIVNYMFFGDAKQGWREGIPYKFHLSITERNVRVNICGRQWTGRPILESRDQRDHCPAINTWYYGYPERIYETTSYENKVIPNYSEEQILGIARWVQGYLGSDPDRCYLSGGSMGGSGAVSMGFHNPDVFAHIDARVPAVAYTPEGNLWRLECFCGPLDDTAVNHNGEPFLEHMNQILTAQRSKTNLPFLFMLNGRADGSILWPNNPPFYRAMNEAKQGFVAYWSGGEHGSAGKEFPGNSHFAPAREKFGFDKSYLAFSNCSNNDDPGNGDMNDGDVVGWINRGLDWEDIVDTPAEYSVTALAYHDGLEYPLTVDMTPRRLQEFMVKPGEMLNVLIKPGEPQQVKVDENGLITIPGLTIFGRDGTRIQIEKAEHGVPPSRE